VEALIPITFFMSVAAVLILRPITKKLGSLLELMTRERTQVRNTEVTDARVVSLLEHMSKRLDAMEERLDFTERLVDRPSPSPRLGRRQEQPDLQRI
jgi:hypothetical protein